MEKRLLAKKIGFVQTPQAFYNADLFQFNLGFEKKIPNEQDYFHRDIQLARNATNTVIYSGSNTVLSREAMEAVGGFKTDSITEDFATGIELQSHGYVCYAINDVLATGLSPTDLKNLVKQRKRWARGCIQSARKANILFQKGLNLEQKLHYLSSVTYWYASIKRVFYIMAPIMFSVFWKQVFICTLPQVLMFWLPTYVLTASTLKILSSEIRTTKWTNIYETIFFPSLFFPVIIESFGISKLVFEVTGKNKVKNDNTYNIKIGLVYLVFILLSIVGIINMITATITHKSLGFIVVLFWLFSNLKGLLFSLIFVIGRNNKHMDDKFIDEVNCVIEIDEKSTSCVTEAFSTEEIILAVDQKINIPKNKRCILHFNYSTMFSNPTAAQQKQQTLNLTVRCKNSFQQDGLHKYRLIIKESKDQDIEEWIQFVHDRDPFFPTEIDDDFGLLDDIVKMTSQRLDDMKKEESLE